MPAFAGCGGAASPSPGPIVFASNAGLMVVNPDGTGLRRLTRDGGIKPSWSPDGTKVAFESAPEHCDPDFLACSEIWVVNADGSGERRLTDEATRNEDPDWSPAGELIAFSRWQNNELGDLEERSEIDIYAVSAEGDAPKRLTSLPGAEEDPAWSPDGKQIAFSADQGDGADIYVMDANGSHPQRLTHTEELEFFPAWSPDGDTIAFERRGGGPTKIVVLHVDAAEERELGAANTDWGQPAWAPDGKQLAFTTDDDSTIWVVDADGRNVRKVWSESLSQPWGLDWASARD